jgi:hypothetical protein
MSRTGKSKEICGLAIPPAAQLRRMHHSTMDSILQAGLLFLQQTADEEGKFVEFSLCTTGVAVLT